jgi:hypothetical protein
MGGLTLNDRERAVLEVIGKHENDADGKGIAASGIVSAMQGYPGHERAWSAQQAGRIAGLLCDLGYARGTRTSLKTFYRLSSMGRGYLSVED